MDGRVSAGRDHSMKANRSNEVMKRNVQAGWRALFSCANGREGALCLQPTAFIARLGNSFDFV